MTLSISGGEADCEAEAEVSDDGTVYFQIPRQRVGSRITVSIAVKQADGSIVRSGSKTMLVTEGCQFSVTLINGSPVTLPATLKSASSINSILTSLGAGSGGTARNFSPSLTPPPEGATTYELSASGSGVQVLAWLDGNAIRYYADGMDACGIIPLPANSRSMLSGCESLTSIDLSGFDASGMTSMSRMFEECNNLTSLDVSGWDTSNVTDMSWMFNDCYKLTSLDASSFDTFRVTKMYWMFAQSRNLTTIYASSSFVTDAVTDTGPFWNSKALRGGAGPTYSIGAGNEYARIDGGPSAPGYFTAR
ncbi:MAG: BspA family leucine-rich repeat surface protein [Treponema sp.]|nr:BspA family leucine-rich repeat surface protein [Treponema sp.]